MSNVLIHNIARTSREQAVRLRLQANQLNEEADRLDHRADLLDRSLADSLKRAMAEQESK